MCSLSKDESGGHGCVQHNMIHISWCACMIRQQQHQKIIGTSEAIDINHPGAKINKIGLALWLISSAAWSD